jgi:Family of unknown function (DUF6515)
MKNKFWLVMGICSILFLMGSESAFAWGWARNLPSHHSVVMLRGARYHYYHGRFYRPGPIGFFMVTPPIGVVVSILPDGYRTIVYGGIPYYYEDNVYYTDSSNGYVVVPAPANVAAAQPATEPATTTATTTTPPGKTITINVPNSSGSFTPIKLVKYKNGYLGPQGEYYPGNPTVDQLSVLYGK